ncbi:ead/Ea22-like family protein [Citrobacter farmeri]|nr:ead/Ea22-like family protein [Citrobacter farmeri]
MTIDKQALRKAAIAATGGKWVFSRSGANSNVQTPIELQKGGKALVVLCKLNNAGWSGQIQTENNAKFIAAANPETVLALLDDLEAAEHTAAVDHEAACSLVEENEEVKRKLAASEKRIAELRDWNLGLAQESLTHQQRIAEISGQKRLIGWRASDYTDETSDPELAKNWAAAIGVLPIFEGDVNTKLSAAGIGKGE